MTLEEVLQSVQRRSDFLAEQYPGRELCVWSECPNVKDNTELGDDNLCCYHRMLIDYWFFEVDNCVHAPVIFDAFTGRREIPPPGADPDLATYRARYQKWANDLGK